MINYIYLTGTATPGKSRSGSNDNKEFSTLSKSPPIGLVL